MQLRRRQQEWVSAGMGFMSHNSIMAVLPRCPFSRAAVAKAEQILGRWLRKKAHIGVSAQVGCLYCRMLCQWTSQLLSLLQRAISRRNQIGQIGLDQS